MKDILSRHNVFNCYTLSSWLLVSIYNQTNYVTGKSLYNHLEKNKCKIKAIQPLIAIPAVGKMCKVCQSFQHSYLNH